MPTASLDTECVRTFVLVKDMKQSVVTGHVEPSKTSTEKQGRRSLYTLRIYDREGQLTRH